jgi:ribosomal-protein-alanine N-acetyltransferase
LPVIGYGFRELELHRIEACPLASNTASRNLLLKLSFSYEGNLRQRDLFRGRFEDQAYYGLLKGEWPASV